MRNDVDILPDISCQKILTKKQNKTKQKLKHNASDLGIFNK